MPKKALVTGATGQDGSYLVEWLLEKGYEVHGLSRSLSPERSLYLKGPLGDSALPLHLHEGSLADSGFLSRLLGDIRPDEVYNLAAQSDDEVSLSTPEYTAEINGLGPVRLLEAIRKGGFVSRFFQASSSEIFGLAQESPQNENTPLKPRSPYGFAKVFAQGMVGYYRDIHRIFAASGILFNHESPRRGEAFVTRKISRGLARIVAGKQDKLKLGNLEARRDWGFAQDYVKAMWLMLQQEKPEDFVIATGESHTIREFLEEAFSYVGLDYRKVVESDPRLVRSMDIPAMRGDSSKARKVLGWKPSVDFRQLVRLMVDADLAALGLKPPSA